MTILDYLQNPYGKGSAIGQSSSRIKEDYTAQYNKLSSKIKHKIYLYRNYVIYHIIIPSKDETRNVTYDVVLEFNMSNLQKEDVSILGLEYSIFSNCPSFIFSFANIFYSKEMLCKWLMAKYNPEVKKNFPTTRNAYGVIGAERSIYLAMLYLKNNHIDRLDTINNTAIKVHSYSQIAQYIRTQNDIMSSYKDSRLKVDPNTVKSGTDDSFKKKSNKDARGNRVNASNVSPRSSFISKTKTTKQTKSTKKTKKI